MSGKFETKSDVLKGDLITILSSFNSVSYVLGEAFNEYIPSIEKVVLPKIEKYSEFIELNETYDDVPRKFKKLENRRDLNFVTSNRKLTVRQKLHQVVKGTVKNNYVVCNFEFFEIQSFIPNTVYHKTVSKNEKDKNSYHLGIHRIFDMFNRNKDSFEYILNSEEFKELFENSLLSRLYIPFEMFNGVSNLHQLNFSCSYSPTGFFFDNNCIYSFDDNKLELVAVSTKFTIKALNTFLLNSGETISTTPKKDFGVGLSWMPTSYKLIDFVESYCKDSVPDNKFLYNEAEDTTAGV